MIVERQPGLVVYLCGLGTSALTLFLVRLLAEHGENVMGWYANGILPVGALMVGIASGSGFALASRFFNIRLTKSYVLGMLTTGVLDYAAANYLTYLNLLEVHHVPEGSYSFWQYMRDLCENMSFRRAGSSSEPGSPLGAFGYFFKLLELVGFAGGTMVPSAVLFSMPYCKRCQRYLLKHRAAFVSSQARKDEVLKLPKAQRGQAIQQSVQEVCLQAQELGSRIAQAPLPETVAALRGAGQADDGKAAARVHVLLKKCPRCDAHHLQFTLHHVTADKKPAVGKLMALDKTGHAAAPVAPAPAPAAVSPPGAGAP